MKELSKQVKALWGKKSNVDGQELWQPLVVHLLDTKNVINWLYGHWLTDGQRKAVQGGLSEEAGQQLAGFLGAVHDLGKATPVFQIKKSYNGDQDLDDQLMEHLIQVGFDQLGDLILASPRESPHALAGEALLEQLESIKRWERLLAVTTVSPSQMFPGQKLMTTPKTIGKLIIS